MTVSNRPDALIWRSRGFIRPARSPELSAKTKNWYSPKESNLDRPLIRQTRYRYARGILVDLTGSAPAASALQVRRSPK